MAIKDLIYLIFHPAECTCPSQCGYPCNPEYWEQFESLVEATKSSGGRDIYTARPRLLGKYKMVTKPVRIKTRRKKKCKL